MTRRSLLIADDLEPATEPARLRSQYIQRLAGSLAELLELPVNLIYVKPDKEASSSLHRRLRESQKGRLQKSFKDVMRNFTRPGRLLVEVGAPVDAIVKTIKADDKIEALVLGTSGKEGLEFMFLGSVAEEVLRSVACPVFILGPKAQAEDFRLSDFKKIKILVATDFSERSRPTEEYALAFAKKT